MSGTYHSKIRYDYEVEKVIFANTNLVLDLRNNEIQYQLVNSLETDSLFEKYNIKTKLECCFITIYENYQNKLLPIVTTGVYTRFYIENTKRKLKFPFDL